MTLQTARLVLRPWVAGDREPFAAMNADPEVMEHFPGPLTRAGSDALADRIEQAFVEQGGWGLFAIEERGRFVGFTGLAKVGFAAHFTPAVEIGWRLERAARGRGVATEAAREVVRFGFGELGLDELVSLAAVGNVRSQAVMRRLGMTHDPADDFDHPHLPAASPLRRHVLYRLRAGERT